MRRLIIFTIGCLFSQSIYAQEKAKTFNHLDRYIVSEALLFLDQYEIDKVWRGKGDKDMFPHLFGKTATVVNDIPMANSQQMVSLNKYIDDLSSKRRFNRSRAYVRLYPYSISLKESNSSDIISGSGSIFIDLKKTIKFKSPNDDRAIYRDTLDQNFHLKYNYNENGINFYIERISSNDIVGKYIVVKYSSKGLSEEELQEQFGGAFVESKEGINKKDDSDGIFTLNDFSKENDIYVYSGNTLFYQKKSIAKSFKAPPAGDTLINPSNFSELRFRKKGWSISPEFNFEWRILSSQASSFNSDVTSNVTQMGYGLVLGKRLFSKIDQSLTFQLGGGMTRLDSKFEITPFTSSSAEVDDAGDPYTRITRTKRLSETGQLSRNYFSFVLNYNRRWGTTEVGIFTGGNYYLGSVYNYVTDASAKYSGLYGPEYFNILIDDPAHYSFGVHTVYLEDQAVLGEELNLMYGLTVLQDLNRRTQFGVSFGYKTVLNSPFDPEDKISTYFTDFQSVQELDARLWNDRFISSISIIYFL
jgi:hypothetical protein